MSELEPESGESPTLQPHRPSWASQSPMPPMPQMHGPYMPQGGPPRKRTSAVKVIFLVLGLLLLAGSLAMNGFLLMGLGLDFEQRGAMQTSVMESGNHSETVALYNVTGILDGQATARFRQFYRAVIEDGNVKAVVLRVNSPGGGVTASDQICEMVKSLKAAGKKVVVSMGSMAASGGYYISAPADEIYAEATSITGSIGVIAGWVVLKGTLDKIGAEPVVIKSSHADGWKDEMSSFSAPHDYQRKHIQGVLDKMQERFEEVVMAGRGKRLKTRSVSYTIPPAAEGGEPIERTETEPLNGKIYLAEKAKELGLIDSIGYQDAAIRRAAQLAGLSNERVVLYSRRPTFMELMMQGKSEDSVKLGMDLVEKLQTPRFMMIWKVD